MTDADARPTGRTRRQLAADDTLVVRGALERDFRDRSIKGLAVGALYGLVATIVVIVVFWGFSSGFRRIYARLQRFSGTTLEKKVALLGVGGFGQLLIGGARLMRVVLSAIVLSLYVNLTLSFFPWTRGLAQQLFGYLAIQPPAGPFTGSSPTCPTSFTS